jgi:hypothetical protein
MTALAVLVTMLTHNSHIEDDLIGILSLAVANLTLLLVALAIIAMNLHWLLRLAIVFGGALVIGVFCEITGLGLGDELPMPAYFLIQAVVLMLWLELHPFSEGGAVAASEASEAASSPPT